MDSVRFEFQNAWVRLLIEFFPRTLPIRRYRVAREDAPQARSRMVRYIRRQLRPALDSS